MRILVLNGPNINLLGLREPDIYGIDTYESLCSTISAYCKARDIEVFFYQTNHEGCIVDKIQESMKKIDGIVLNPAAYTHTSIAIPDAIKATQIPTVEVHISNVDKREDFRKISYVAPACIATIKGHGIDGYKEAIDILCKHIEGNSSI